jgi:hypothetical protein
MLANIMRAVIATSAGIMFLYCVNNLIFFTDFNNLSEHYSLLIFVLVFIPLFFSFLIFGDNLTFWQNISLNGAFFLSGLLIAQGAFVAFNDTYVNKQTKVAYQELQKIFNISDTVTYSEFQKEFLKDKEANDYKALTKYSKNFDTFKSVDTEKVAVLILAMDTNKDPILQEKFNAIIADKIVTVQEFNEFNYFVVKQKMEQVK